MMRGKQIGEGLGGCRTVALLPDTRVHKTPFCVCSFFKQKTQRQVIHAIIRAVDSRLPNQLQVMVGTARHAKFHRNIVVIEWENSRIGGGVACKSNVVNLQMRLT